MVNKIGRPKGTKNRSWSKDEKLRIISRHLDDKISQRQVAEEENISCGMLSNWVKKYIDEGPEALENQRKKGNKFAALHRSKKLDKVKELELIIAMQEIEIERLKKGYMVKGDGGKKEFVILKDKSLK